MSQIAGVRSAVDVGLAVLRKHQEVPYRLWLLARYIDESARGWVATAELRAAAKRYLRCTTKTVARTLDAGEANWWTIRGDRIYLIGLGKVCQRLDVYRCDAAIIPLARLANLAGFRAGLMAALFAKDPLVMSLDTLCSIVSRSRRTVINWCRHAGLHVTVNLMVSHRAVEDYGPELAAQGYYVDRSGEQPRLVKRMPNAYRSDLQSTTIGIIRHLATPSSHTGSGALRRRYYDDPMAAQRAWPRLADGETIYLRCGRTGDGTQLWESLVRWERQLCAW